MIKRKEFDLLQHNSFRLTCTAQNCYIAKEWEDIVILSKELENPLIIGGGSNMLLLPTHIERSVILIQTKGIKTLFENDDFYIVSAAAGEDWQALVEYTLANNMGGLENLNLIPGKVGAAPIQNIGAYGVELSDVFYALEAIEIGTSRLLTFNLEMCKFGYRNSIFKNEKKGAFVIARLFLKLPKNHQINSSYGGVHLRLQTKGIEHPTIRNMADTIAEIRREKLPYPDTLPNSGSFFKNPIISSAKLKALQEFYPFIPFYEVKDKMQAKIPAAWLIENAGYKAYRKGDAGVYHAHALILVNHGKATGKELYSLAMEIIEEVKRKFEIELEPEVNIIYGS